MEGISKEVKILHPEIEQLAYAPSVQMTETGLDTIPTFLISWKTGIGRSTKRKKTEVLGSWLQERLDLDTTQIIEY